MFLPHRFLYYTPQGSAAQGAIYMPDTTVSQFGGGFFCSFSYKYGILKESDRMPQTETGLRRYRKRGAGMRVLKSIGLFLLSLAVIAAAVVTVWFVAFPSVPAAVLDVQQSVSALSASLQDLPADLRTQQAQLEALPVIVKEADCDTLYYTVNTAEGIGWRDRDFPTEPRLVHAELMGLVDRRFDALSHLTDACAAQGVQLIAVIDVNALSGGLSGDRALADDAFVTALSGAVRDLSTQYGVGAVALAFPDPPTDSTANREAVSGIARQCHVPLALELPAGHGLLRVTDIGVSLAVARVDAPEQAEAAAVLSARAVQQGLPVLWLAPDAQVLSAAAYYAAGMGLPAQSCVWASARQADLEPHTLTAARAAVSALEGSDLPSLVVPTIGQTLAVGYPANGATVYSGTVYIMGTSDPAQPLELNGSAVRRTGTGGTFGVLVELDEGENTFVLTQQDVSVTLTVNRVRAAQSEAPLQRDGTKRLYEGTRIRVKSWIASVLSDPDNEDMIKETAKQGGVAVVNRCATTVRDGKYTYIYELTTGGWIPAYHCEVVSENIGPWPLGDFAVAQDGADEYITLVRGGTALGYDNWDEAAGVLTVTLANTEAEAGTYTTDSRFVTAVAVESVQGGTRLTFHTDGVQQLWGYDVTYTEAGDTVLYLKAAPQLELDSAQPLKGATVLLDAGHGAEDLGAAGIAGLLGGPCEKDLNLAVALAVQTRLRQLGAEVVMVRGDDTFLSLEERSRLANAVHPDVYLAVHHNSVAATVDANTVSGTSAYYFTLPGKQLADHLTPRVAAAGSRDDDGSSWSYFYVTRMTYTPAVLLEYGFLVNPAEYEACADPITILREGDATAQGILEFFRARLR